MVILFIFNHFKIQYRYSITWNRDSVFELIGTSVRVQTSNTAPKDIDSEIPNKRFGCLPRLKLNVTNPLKSLISPKFAKCLITSASTAVHGAEKKNQKDHPLKSQTRGQANAHLKQIIMIVFHVKSETTKLGYRVKIKLDPKQCSSRHWNTAISDAANFTHLMRDQI